MIDKMNSAQYYFADKKTFLGDDTSLTRLSSGDVKNKLHKIEADLTSGNFTSALDLCKQILSVDSKNAHAYFYCFMAENNIKTRIDIPKKSLYLLECKNYQSAMQFADAEFQTELQKYVKEQDEYKTRQYVLNWFFVLIWADILLFFIANKTEGMFFHNIIVVIFALSCTITAFLIINKLADLLYGIGNWIEKWWENL